MHNLFYLEREQNIIDFEEDNGFDFLDSVTLLFKDGTEKNIDIQLFLHGYCDVFAYRLREKYGYDICFDYNDEDCKDLIHAYCTTTINDRTFWIDCRGITDDYDEFMDEFSDWECFGNLDSTLPWFKDKSKQILNRNGKFSKEHKIIDEIFECYSNSYDINKELHKVNEYIEKQCIELD